MIKWQIKNIKIHYETSMRDTKNKNTTSGNWVADEIQHINILELKSILLG